MPGLKGLKAVKVDILGLAAWVLLEMVGGTLVACVAYALTELTFYVPSDGA